MREQFLPVDLLAFLGLLLLCPGLRDLLGYRLRGTMDDLDAQPGLPLGPLLAPALVTRVYPQPRETRKELAGSLQQQLDPVLVGHLSAVDLDFENQAFRIDEQVPLAPANLLAAVVTARFAA